VIGAQKRILTGLAAVGGLSAANFSPDADGHRATLITDPAAGAFTVMRKQFLGRRLTGTSYCRSCRSQWRVQET
jgi:hypothetical protein